MFETGRIVLAVALKLPAVRDVVHVRIGARTVEPRADLAGVAQGDDEVYIVGGAPRGKAVEVGHLAIHDHACAADKVVRIGIVDILNRGPIPLDAADGLSTRHAGRQVRIELAA